MDSILIKNGKIFDGMGNPWFKGDVAIAEGKIATIGRLDPDDFSQVFDATGLIVCPGFIDMHTHSDWTLVYNPTADSHVMQGITTDVVGNCGMSAAPLTELTRRRMNKAMEYYNLEYDWITMIEYLGSLANRGISVNIAALVGQGSVRAAVLGMENRAPSREEMEEMKQIVRESMEAGAFGISTGLFYSPGGYATTYEVIQLARIVAEYNGFYTSHMRGECDRIIPAVKELIEIAESGGLPGHISHFHAMGEPNWGLTTGRGWNLIKKARERGTDITLDCYAWIAGHTGLFAFFPAWAQEGGPEKLIERLKDPETRERIKVEMRIGSLERESQPGNIGWDHEIISRSSQHPEYEGKSFAEVAQEQGKDPLELALDLYMEDQRVGCLDQWGCEEDLRGVMNLPVFMLSSDSSGQKPSGYMKLGLAHPRTYGNVPNFLGKYVRDQSFLTLEDAIRKGTSFPAQRLGLQDRGVLKKDMWADLLVFDYGRIKAVGTYQDPYHFPEGIKWVFINGVLTVNDGVHTGARAGQVLRHKHT